MPSHCRTLTSILYLYATCHPAYTLALSQLRPSASAAGIQQNVQNVHRRLWQLRLEEFEYAHLSPLRGGWAAARRPPVPTHGRSKLDTRLYVRDLISEALFYLPPFEHRREGACKSQHVACQHTTEFPSMVQSRRTRGRALLYVIIDDRRCWRPPVANCRATPGNALQKQQSNCGCGVAVGDSCVSIHTAAEHRTSHYSNHYQFVFVSAVNPLFLFLFFIFILVTVCVYPRRLRLNVRSKMRQQRGAQFIISTDVGRWFERQRAVYPTWIRVMRDEVVTHKN